METNEVFDKVKGLFVEDLGIDESKVTMEAKLEEDLEIDSLGIVEVVMAFEDEFDIEINSNFLGKEVVLFGNKDKESSIIFIFDRFRPFTSCVRSCNHSSNLRKFD